MRRRSVTAGSALELASAGAHGPDARRRGRERVAVRAFELYEARGGEYGQDRDD